MSSPSPSPPPLLSLSLSISPPPRDQDWVIVLNSPPSQVQVQAQPHTSSYHPSLPLHTMHSFLKSLGKTKSSYHNQTSVPSSVRDPSVDLLGRLATSSSPTPSADNQSSDPQSNLIHDQEFQLIYGYIGIHTEIEFDILTTSRSVNLIARELKARALETPLLFSTHALDISTEVTHSLIRHYVHNPQEFFQHLPLHSAHNLSAFLKWVLSRHVNATDTHGFIKWKQYSAWRDSEATFGYHPRFLSTHLFSQLSPPVASLLSCLLDLFASTSLRADMNGMTVHKCATLFGSYIFGLEHDQPFEQTYRNWLRYSHATEHLVLAHMRDLKAQSPTGKVPLRMEDYIKGYPSIIPSLATSHPSARLEKVARFRKVTPSYSPNLIATAGTWKIVRSKTWDRLKPYPVISAAQYLNNQKAGISSEPSKLLFSQSFKHLLNIGANIDLNDDEDNNLNTNFEGPQRFRTLVEKEWSGFMARGFQQPDAKKLQFNLEESSDAQLKMKRGTMDWASFSDAGFIGRETYRAKELEFNSDIQISCSPSISPSSPASKKSLTKKLMKTAKMPSFPSYGTVPTELPSQSVDDDFFEAWADVLVASGWCRDEPKEVSWVLLHCKCKAVDHQDFEFRPTSLNPDGRNEEMWTLFEEVVPKEHQLSQQNASKLSNIKSSNRRSFLRAIIRKDHKKPFSVDNLPSIPAIPAHFLSSPSDSLTRWENTSQSSVPQTLALNSSLDSSPATRNISTPQGNSMGKLRAITKKIQGHGGGNHITSVVDPSHSTILETSEINSVYAGSAKISSFAGHTRGQSEKCSETDHRSYDQPLYHTTTSLNQRPNSSRTSGETRTSDPDDLVHPGNRISGNWGSTDSSDYTVELVERLVEPPVPVGVALSSIKSVDNLKSIPTPNDSSTRPLYSFGNNSAHTLTSRSLAYDTDPTSMYTSMYETSSEILPSIKSWRGTNLSSAMKMTTDYQEEPLNSYYRRQGGSYYSRKATSEGEDNGKENTPSRSTIFNRTQDSRMDSLVLPQISSLSISSTTPRLNKFGYDMKKSVDSTSPLTIRELSGYSFDGNTSHGPSSPKYYDSSYSSNVNVQIDKECWFTSTKNASSSSLQESLSSFDLPLHHLTIPVSSTTPANFDFKSFKVSSIVDMFEKGQPGSSGFK